VSVSTASRALGALERDLGVQLVARTTRRMKLTEAGTRLYDHARRIALELEQARAEIAAPRGHGRRRRTRPSARLLRAVSASAVDRCRSVIPGSTRSRGPQWRHSAGATVRFTNASRVSSRRSTRLRVSRRSLPPHEA
jgi:DNA-binding transcriptional LysR family regulator